MSKRISALLNSYFKLSDSKTTIRTEVLAGITTFITVAYVLILNPQILSHPYTIMGDMDMAGRISNGVFIGTCIAAFVGILMLSSVKDVDLNNMEKAMPAFCTIVFMPFTYSIANGIALGLITHCLILLLTGKAREVKPLTIIVSLVFIARYAFITLG